MSTVRRKQVAKAFSAARDYDRHARVQARVADDLAARIAGLELPPSPRILEIGCGTGHLTGALLRNGLGGEWLVTDISPQMVERCRARIGERKGLRYAVLDGETAQPEFAGRFDLVCSSLAMQWFEDLAGSLARMLTWLAPGGHLLFTTLGAETFAEWREAHEREGLQPGTPKLLSASRLETILKDAQAAPPLIEYHRDAHKGALSFLQSLKSIGAGTPSERHRALSLPQLRRVMRNFENSGATVTYEVVTCHYSRQLEQR